jgi:hypothetical protein
MKRLGGGGELGLLQNTHTLRALEGCFLLVENAAALGHSFFCLLSTNNSFLEDNKSCKNTVAKIRCACVSQCECRMVTKRASRGECRMSLRHIMSVSSS